MFVSLDRNSRKTAMVFKMTAALGNALILIAAVTN